MKDITLADIFANTPEGIVAGERAGGRALVREDKLPFKGVNGYQAKFEALGFTFGTTIGQSTDGGPMYIECSLPEGWRKGSDPNDYYGRGSYLFDPQGRKRASMFTKETSYDRYATLSLYRRYKVHDLYVDEKGAKADYGAATHVRVVLADSEEEFKLIGQCAKGDHSTQNSLRERARTELLKTYPEADDPFAYWEQK